MNGIIYKIVNTENDKVYIGCTHATAHKRFIEHKSKSRLNYKNKIQFHIAMNRIGVDKFSVYELGSYSNDVLHDMEKFYVKEYDSFRNGYNSDIGGNGGQFDYSDKEVVKKYKELGDTTKVRKYFKTSSSVITGIMKRNNIPLYDSRKSVTAYNDSIIKSFNSLMLAARWLMDNKYTTCNNQIYVKRNISAVLYGISVTYLGFNWSFN